MGFASECSLSTVSNLEGAIDPFSGLRGNTYGGSNQVAIGSGAKAVGKLNTALGSDARVGDEFNPDRGHSNCVAVGFLSNVQASNSVAVGGNATVSYSTTASEPGSAKQGNRYSTVIGTNARSTGFHGIAIGGGEISSSRRVIAGTNEIVIGDAEHTSVTIGPYNLSTLGGSNPWYAIGAEALETGSQGNFTIEGSQAFSSGAGDYEIVMVGGGGGGREGEPNSGNQSSSGGGAGGCAKFTLAWDGTTAINVSVGDGGHSSPSPNVYSNGGNSQIWLGSITAANLVVTANGGGMGWKATSSYNGEIVSGGAGGTVVFNSTLPTGISNTRGFQGGNGGAADFTLSGGNFVACMACGGGGAVNFLELTNPLNGVSDGGQTSGGRARVTFLNGTAAGAGGSIFGVPPTVTASAQSSLTTVSTSRGDVHTGNARSRTNAAAGGSALVFETVGGNDVGGPFFDNVPVGRSFAVLQPGATTNVSANNQVVPDVNVGVMGGGGFAKNNSQAETTSHLYQAQNGFLFGGGGGAACGNQNQSTLPTGGRGGYGGGGGAGGSNINRGFDRHGYGGDGIILIRKL